jgi:crossover junction endodeoxyribonuclease RusA
MSDVLARFTIPGNPRPKERPRHGRGFTYTPPGTIIAELSVLTAFNDAYPDWQPVDCKVELTATFYRDSKRAVDADNLAKLVQDALNKHAFADDSQVFDLHSHKWFTTKDRARTEVVISRVYGDRVEVTS